jgi:hypothetical protein
MAKLLLMSVMIMTIFIPVWAARTKNAAAGARKAVTFFGLFTVFWIVFVAYYFTDMTPPVDLDPFKAKENSAKWQ